MTDRGSITIVVCAAAFVLLLGALAVADAGAMLVARQRAQTAADSAALAAAVEQVPALATEDDPREVARIQAERNGATLDRCDCERGTARAVVVVSVRRRGVFLPGWIGRAVRATAAAEVDAGLLTYRR